MTLTAPPANVAALLSGQPSLLLLDGIPGAEALAAALPGLRCWRVQGLRMSGFGVDLPGDATLPALPAGVLAILAPSQAAAAPLLACWQGLPAPPLLVVAEAAAAWMPLAQLALAETAAAAERAAGLHRALVATRQDYEETRSAMAVLMQSSGFRAPLALETALACEPGPSVATEAGHLALGQLLSISVESLAAVALHIAEAEVSADARLRLRLYGAESGRVLAAWLVPAEALKPGWLALDLPAPVGPVRESACLDLIVEGAVTDRLALSLEDAPADAARSAQQDTGEALPVSLGRALALRLWQAPFGRRFTMPLYWQWEQGDLPLPPPAAVPVATAQQVWPLARLPLGGSNVSLGAEAPRPLLVLAPGAEAMAVLPWVPVAGLDLLQASIALPEGAAEGLEVALWLQPAGCGAETPAELELAAPGARCSGWRAVPADGAGLDLSLRLPLDAAPTLAVVLLARLAATAPAACRLEWAELVGRSLGRMELPEPPAAPLVSKPRPAECGAVRMHEHYHTPDGGYRHLDMTLEHVRLGGTAWPAMRFKLALNGAAPNLEFRLRPDWPVLFQHWPGDVVDQHGPVFLMPEDRLAAMLDGMRSARDAQAIRALVQLLPGVVRGLPREAGDPGPWLEAARRLAALLG